MDTSQRWAAVGTHVTERMKELGLLQADLVRLSGLSEPTVRRLMYGEPGAYRDANLAKIAIALGWTHDSIRAIIDGGEPTERQSTRTAIMHDPYLDEHYREVLLGTYDDLVRLSGERRSERRRR